VTVQRALALLKRLRDKLAWDEAVRREMANPTASTPTLGGRQ
jgi:hypothetical protein